jgi:hypothetical protein
MSWPPAARSTLFDPSGMQVRADGQQVEVRTLEGEVIRSLPLAAAQALLAGGLAGNLPHCVRLKLGIRWLTDMERERICESLQAEAQRLRNISIQVEFGQSRLAPVQGASGG